MSEIRNVFSVRVIDKDTNEVIASADYGEGNFSLTGERMFYSPLVNKLKQIKKRTKSKRIKNKLKKRIDYITNHWW
jgi:glutamine amidotransferase-like uncharacterized protein